VRRKVRTNANHFSENNLKIILAFSKFLLLTKLTARDITESAIFGETLLSSYLLALSRWGEGGVMHRYFGMEGNLCCPFFSTDQPQQMVRS